MPPRGTPRAFDFQTLPDAGAPPELPIEAMHALLADEAFPSAHRPGTFRVEEALQGLNPERFGRLAPPMDTLTVSVSHPVVADTTGEFVAGVLFRQAHDVVPTATGDGMAMFGVEVYEENIVGHDPPPPGARAEVSFSPPRTNTRYLLEFWCSGESSVHCGGSDGSSLQSNGPFSVVLFSGTHQVTYTLESDGYWWFRRCAIHWLSE